MLMNSFYRNYGKRLFDLLLSCLLLVVLSPLYLLLWIMVRLKLGSPVFFLQDRPGKDERIFSLIKFRSMTDARDDSGDLLADEKRLTRFGKFLRKSSLDELPEIWNIFCGDMSFIGPRPLSLFYLPSYSSSQRQRHRVRPGLSGLAQIRGRNNSQWTDRLADDLTYIEQLSLGLDLKIILQTIGKVVRQSDVNVRDDDALKNFNVFQQVEEERVPTDPMAKNSNEIGSDFEWMEPCYKDSPSLYEFLQETDQEDLLWTFSGRSALAQILADIQLDQTIRTAFLPSYSCISMLQPFLDCDIKLRFYDVTIDQKSWQMDFDQVSEGDVFLFMEYFGFSTAPENLAEELEHMKKRGMILIQDITHNLFDPRRFSFKADYSAASIRKWGAVAAGGIAYKQRGYFSVKTDIYSKQIVTEKLAAMKQKRAYLSTGQGNKEDFLKASADFNNGFIRFDPRLMIDPFSLAYLKNTSWSWLVKKRRDNARWLMEHLSASENYFIPVDKSELSQAVPLFVPLILTADQRDNLRSFMIRRQIYLPIHWPESFGADDSVKKRELSLVCDQRYDQEDMQRIIDAICQWEAS